MKRLKRLSSLATASVLSVSALLNIALVPVAGAAADTCTWTGAGGNNDFSTAANWSGCDNGTVPENGDALVFPSNVTDRAPVNNLISASFTSLTFTGTDPSAGYTFTGNSMTISGNINASAPAPNLQMFSNTVVLGANITTSGSISFSVLNTSTFDITLGDYTSVLDDITGSGDITANGMVFLDTGPITTWTGSLTLDNDASVGIGADTLPDTTPITVQDGSSIYVCAANGASIPNPLSLAGSGRFGQGAVGFYDSCSGSAEEFTALGNVNWTGPITLTANTLVNGNGEFKISGSLTGAYTIKIDDGLVGKLVVNASPNSSQTTNGTYASVKKTTTLSGTSSAPVSVRNNNITIIEGTRGQVDVDSGGILKGTGTVGNLTVDDGGVVAPGNSPGRLNTSNFVLNGTYEFEVGGTAAGTGYDQIAVTGTVNLTGSTLLATLFNGFVPEVGQSYTIIDNDAADAVTGTFTDIAEGDTYTNQGVTYSVTYVGGSGNDVVLTVDSVDEEELPEAPNTGFRILTANPLVTLLGATLAAGAILAARKQLQPAPAKRRK